MSGPVYSYSSIVTVFNQPSGGRPEHKIYPLSGSTDTSWLWPGKTDGIKVGGRAETPEIYMKSRSNVVYGWRDIDDVIHPSCDFIFYKNAYQAESVIAIPYEHCICYGSTTFVSSEYYKFLLTIEVRF